MNRALLLLCLLALPAAAQEPAPAVTGTCNARVTARRVVEKSGAVAGTEVTVEFRTLAADASPFLTRTFLWHARPTQEQVDAYLRSACVEALAYKRDLAAATAWVNNGAPPVRNFTFSAEPTP